MGLALIVGEPITYQSLNQISCANITSGVAGHGEGYKVPASDLNSFETISPEEILLGKV